VLVGSRVRMRGLVELVSRLEKVSGERGVNLAIDSATWNRYIGGI
jgi:hypothetical protein